MMRKPVPVLCRSRRLNSVTSSHGNPTSSSASLSAVSMGVASFLDLAARKSNLPAMRGEVCGPERQENRCVRLTRHNRD